MQKDHGLLYQQKLGAVPPWAFSHEASAEVCMQFTSWREAQIPQKHISVTNPVRNLVLSQPLFSNAIREIYRSFDRNFAPTSSSSSFKHHPSVWLVTLCCSGLKEQAIQAIPRISSCISVNILLNTMTQSPLHSFKRLHCPERNPFRIINNRSNFDLISRNDSNNSNNHFLNPNSRHRISQFRRSICLLQSLFTQSSIYCCSYTFSCLSNLTKLLCIPCRKVLYTDFQHFDFGHQSDSRFIKSLELNVRRSEIIFARRLLLILYPVSRILYHKGIPQQSRARHELSAWA